MALAANMYDALGDEERKRAAAEETVSRVRRALQLNPDDARALVLGAGCINYLGDTQTALQWAERAYEIDPESSSTAYNSACLFAHLGEKERAIDLIEKAIALGSRNRRYYETDVDLDPLRDHPRFQELLRRI